MHARLCARPKGNGSRSLSRVADWCQVESQSHFQALPLRVIYREHHSSNQSVVDWVTIRVKTFSHRQPRQVLFNAPKVFAKRLS